MSGTPSTLPHSAASTATCYVQANGRETRTADGLDRPVGLEFVLAQCIARDRTQRVVGRLQLTAAGWIAEPALHLRVGRALAERAVICVTNARTYKRV
jgi:hypothetical protein